MSMKKESPWDIELHLAAARGDAKRLRVLLDSGRVHVDCKDKDGTTPLILAAAGGHIEAVTELLQQGADPNARRLEAFIFSWDERKTPTKNNNVAKDNLVLGIPEYAGLAEIFQTSPGASS